MGLMIQGLPLQMPNTPYTGVYDEFPDEEEITQEEHMPNTLSEPKPIEDEPHSNYPIGR
jgi:hypothetical protein